MDKNLHIKNWYKYSNENNVENVFNFYIFINNYRNHIVQLK